MNTRVNFSNIIILDSNDNHNINHQESHGFEIDDLLLSLGAKNAKNNISKTNKNKEEVLDDFDW